MATWDFDAIIKETRFLTGRPDASMYSDADIKNDINYFYQYVLPKELKIFWGYTYFTFFTQANVDQYLAPSNFQTINPQVWASGWPICWYINPDTFYQDYPQQENTTVVGTGNGVINSFPFVIPAFPVIQRSVYVTDGVQVAQDVPTNPTTGTFVDSSSGVALGGSIDYLTGQVTGLSFLVPPAANSNISQFSQTYMANRPQAILYFRSQPFLNATPAAQLVDYFVLRPVPDNVYKIKMQGIQIPPELVNLTDVPFRPDLGPLIARGAAIRIFEKFGQLEEKERYLPSYAQYKDVSMQDTYEELLYQRAIPTF